MKPKLTVCSPQLGISPQAHLGGEVHDREIIKALCQKGLEVIVILPRGKPYQKHRNLKVYQLPVPFVWPPWLFNFLILPYLFYIYWRHKFDILRIHSPYFSGLGAWLFRLVYPGVPLAATYHHLPENNWFFDFLDRLLIKKWDKLVTVSQFSKQEIVEKFGLEPEQVAVVYNAVKPSLKPKKKDQRLVERYSLAGRSVLLYLGSFSKRKNLDWLLEVLAGLKTDRVKLLLAGKGGQSAGLKKKTAALALTDQVVFTGLVGQADKPAYYNLADVFVFPSLKEGFGLAVLEAQACGLAVVANDSSSLREIVKDGQTGFLVKEKDLKTWREKIDLLLKNEKLRKEMGQQAKQFAKKFSWEKAGQEHIKIYQDLLAKGQGAI